MDDSARPELVIGLVGPIGVDLDYVQEVISQELSKLKYKSVPLRITDLMRSITVGIDIDETSFSKKYHSLIAYADKVCEEARSSAALAALAVARIRAERTRITSSPEKPALGHAYIVRQFKRPQEIDLMRKTYGRKFVQISVSASEKDRRSELSRKIKEFDESSKDKDECEKEAIDLIKKDFDEGVGSFGQKISNIFHLGDIFVYGMNKKNIDDTLKRFLEAFFGHNGRSPTKMEYGMYTAAAASLRSIDLSRQVGASIFTKAGEILAMGCNEVPKPFGGTYWAEDGENAHRDFERGRDANHSRKLEILHDLLERMNKAGFLSQELSAKSNAIEQLREIIGHADIKDSQVMDLIEFGRMIHAEMSAITDAARTGVSVRNSIMYCTTFPCHMCAKHIVSSGIGSLVYLEPYPKSFAVELNSDSITFDDDLAEKKVLFRPFVGISPRRYRDIFEKRSRKGDDGRRRDWYYGSPLPMIEDKSAAYIENEDSSILSNLGEDIASKLMENSR
ncbi:cytidine deaminase [Rhizobium sp. RU33A]|uniref:anti-phage dCTP deaminase n=1 Tax=Rhizobium sp. RU33A TaxID=1907413 RepID=UPI000953CA1A|nr:anti-phage dCTP deaminase [Rhizobium sp. RU33A]SIQ93363.1 cytidine deaminase [Rhizobium sp. RU33A]